MTRWQVAAAAGPPDACGGLGAHRLRLSSGQEPARPLRPLDLAWDHHEASSSPRRYLSVWLRRLSTDRIARRSAGPADAPLVVAATVKGALRIAALNDAAARLGLQRRHGARRCARDVSGACRSSTPIEAADARLLEAIADWCDRYTPLVGLDPPDGLMLDITGCAHLFGGEAGARAAI